MKYLKEYKTFESNSTSDEYLTKEENQCLKQIYIFLRDVLLDFKKQVSIYYQKNPGQLSISNFIKNHYNLHDKVSKSSDSISVDFDKVNPLIRKTFKSLQNEFIINFIPKDEGASIRSKTDPLRITGMNIGTTKIFNSPEEALKSSLQHEIQHIANIEKEGIEKGDVDSGYIYLTSKKEIDSHAKQFAYLYKKKYPEDKEIDSKKLMNMASAESDMVERSKQKLNLYLWFSSPEQFRKQEQNKNMTDEVYDGIKKAGPKFIEKLKYYFKIFSKK